MTLSNVRLAILCFLPAFSASMPASSAAQQGTPERKALDATIPYFEMSDQTFEDGIAKLTLQPEPLAFGFEQVLRNKLSDSPSGPRFTLKMEDRKSVV